MRRVQWFRADWKLCASEPGHILGRKDNDAQCQLPSNECRRVPKPIARSRKTNNAQSRCVTRPLCWRPTSSEGPLQPIFVTDSQSYGENGACLLGFGERFGSKEHFRPKNPGALCLKELSDIWRVVTTVSDIKIQYDPAAGLKDMLPHVVQEKFPIFRTPQSPAAVFAEHFVEANEVSCH